ALGRCYTAGRGVKLDLVQAESLFREAAGGGQPDAKYQLGLLLIQKGEPVSVAEGMKSLSDAAAGGSVDAKDALGRIYESGEHGVILDSEKALSLFTEAAEGGN